MLPYNRRLKGRSQLLRRNLTTAEQRLWTCLRRKKVGGAQFYRQKPLWEFIVDFYCPKKNLVIEVDGSQHYEQDALEYDAIRTAYLETLDLRVLRFTNAEVLRKTEGVVEAIKEAIG